MGEWSNLTQREKSNIIRFAIKNGVSDINTIRDTFNVYAKDSLANIDYNMAAAKASGFGSNGSGHYPDTFKKPNHPTFSDESIYHSEATPGGKWRGNTYEPSEFVLNQQGGWNQFLRGFYNQEQGTGAVPVFNGGVMLSEVTITPQYKEGGKIYIKPSKRGTFTAAATKHGKSVQEFARQVLAHPENYSPAMRRKANFARNSAHWHWDGGNTNIEPEFIELNTYPNYWLHKYQNGVKTRYGIRPGVVSPQNLQNTLDLNGNQIQYIWNGDEANSYTSYKMNPKYRPALIPAKRIEAPIKTPEAPAIPDINITKPKVQYGFTKKVIPAGKWIDMGGEANGVHGYNILHLENSPLYGIEYQSVPGSVSAGEGSVIQTDSIIKGIPIQELNARIYNYKTKTGGQYNHFSTGGPLYPFSFQKNPYWKTPIVRY